MDVPGEGDTVVNSDISPPVTLAQAALYWLKLGFISFGGPAGQIAIMHHDLVEKKRWISENRFLHALNYCMVLPGPEAQQLATYIGWLMHRASGGLLAGMLFVLPSFFILVGLTWVYMAYGSVPAVAGMLYGFKPAVVAIVLFAAYRIGSRVLKNAVTWGIAGLAFLAIFVFELPFPVIVLAAGLIGYLAGRIAPHHFKTADGQDAAEKKTGECMDWRPYTDTTACFIQQGKVYSRGGHRACHLGNRHGQPFPRLWLGQHIHPNWLVLHQGCLAYFRRSLCCFTVHLSRCSRALPVAHADPDD